MQNDFKINNFLSSIEVDDVLAFYDELPYSQDYSNPKMNKRKLMHYDSTQFLQDIFEPKLKTLFTGGLTSASTFTDWHNPVLIHTDGWQPQEDQTRNMGYAVLVPLRTNPVKSKASTIIFEQRSPGPTVTLNQVTENTPWNIAEYVTADDARIENKKDGITQEFYNTHLKHIQDINMLRNFSVSNVYNWEPGCAIVWDRSYFHTSSSFDETLKSKLHAIFFVTL